MAYLLVCLYSSMFSSCTLNSLSLSKAGSLWSLSRLADTSFGRIICTHLSLLRLFGMSLNEEKLSEDPKNSSLKKNAGWLSRQAEEISPSYSMYSELVFSISKLLPWAHITKGNFCWSNFGMHYRVEIFLCISSYSKSIYSLTKRHLSKSRSRCRSDHLLMEQTSILF